MKRYQLLLPAFLFFSPGVLVAQNRYDVVIDELMADPTPQVGLPNNEWIELKNTTTLPINLQNWRIGDASGQSGPLPNFTLQPDSFVIVCAGSAIAALSAFGTTISVTSFPSLDNDGDQLFLKAANGKTIHAVGYSSGWYQNDLKKEGGWSLEMINPKNPCMGSSNWKASNHSNGGTPGKKNSVDAMNDDTNAPRLNRAYILDPVTVMLVFDEPVDSVSGSILNNYGIDGGLSFVQANAVAPLFHLVQLKLATPLHADMVYTITATNIQDCKGNSMGTGNTARVGLPYDPNRGDWVINEILFNPRPNANDYVEFYNNSTKIFDAARLFIANRNSSGVISSISALSPMPYLVFPGDHIVVTTNGDNLALHYLVKEPGNVMLLSNLPSFPDDEGTVVTLNFQGDIVDEVRYKDDWHFKLISNDEGVSLERIDPSGISQDAMNWHSAASTAGYGTPGYKNSQYKQVGVVTATLTVSPELFSPDNDGRDDIATVQYELSEPGFIANITIFNATGKIVRNFVRNGTMGLKGYWNWDGLGDNNNQLPVGIYIIYTEIFNLQGKKQVYKNPVVLARKLNL